MMVFLLYMSHTNNCIPKKQKTVLLKRLHQVLLEWLAIIDYKSQVRHYHDLGFMVQ